MKALRLLADAIRRPLKLHSHSVDDASENIACRAMESVLNRQRVQGQRNAFALGSVHSGFQERSTQDKPDTLAELVNRRAKHSDSDRHIVTECVHGVVGDNAALHMSSPSKAPTVSGVCNVVR